jgi:hypothetical protein
LVAVGQNNGFDDAAFLGKNASELDQHVERDAHLENEVHILLQLDTVLLI